MEPISIKQREDLPEFLTTHGLLGTGIEVGVRRGKFSKHILETWKGQKLISLDEWPKRGRNFRIALRQLSKFGERSQLLRATSVEGAEQIEDGSLDFLYLDADHKLASVREDLKAWVPKVRVGGLLSGHDYLDLPSPYPGRNLPGFPDRQGPFGVKTAVDEFFGPLGWEVFSSEDTPFISWFVWKREQ